MAGGYTVADAVGPKKIHCVGLEDIGTCAFACLLKQNGYEVLGSAVYTEPWVQEVLDQSGVEVLRPYAARNLEWGPDLVVIGNVVPRGNVEVTTTGDLGIPATSFPEALSRLFLNDKHPVVIAGTHGKSTSTALTAHCLRFNARDPGMLLGAISENTNSCYSTGAEKPGAFFVIEGDEYSTSCFDSGPKFLHYGPRTLLCTNLEYDHADLYGDVGQIVERFRQLIELVPPDGRIILCSEWPHLDAARSLARASAPVQTFGAGGDWQARDVCFHRGGISFDVDFKGARMKGGRININLYGYHNLMNSLGCYATCASLGLSPGEIADAFSAFKGTRRRMEVIREDPDRGIVVVDDFAHHPTAITATVRGLRQRYPNHRLICAFEPRTYSCCGGVFQDDLTGSFRGCDSVLIAPPFRRSPGDKALDVGELVKGIEGLGVRAEACESIDDLVRALVKQVQPLAVFLFMSSGEFGSSQNKFIEQIR